MTEFNCFVGIDWSGAKGPWQKGIKVAIANPGSDVPTLMVGRSPKGRWSRSDVASWLGDLVGKKKALIGMDFAFGFPPTDHLIGEVVLNWDYVERICAGDENFYGGKFFRMPDTAHSCLVNSPWLPKSRYSAHHLRSTELAAKKLKGATPQSIFNACGAAQVGPSSISGMRMLSYLQKQQNGKVKIWPFEESDNARSVIVEIFPRYFPLSKGLSPKMSDYAALNAALCAFKSDKVRHKPESEDEGDAIISAAALRFLSTDSKWLRSPPPPIRHEGWIYGVPFQ